MKKSICLLLVMILAAETSLWAGIPSKKALYLGGTATEIKEGTEGTPSAENESSFRFEYAGGKKLEIPYKNIASLEYGQKAGRRVGATLALGITTLGIGALPILFSKKRKHYLTIGYKNDEGKDQAIVLELGKDVVRPLIATLEARSGKKVEYQDDEARKSGRGN